MTDCSGRRTEPAPADGATAADARPPDARSLDAAFLEFIEDGDPSAHRRIHGMYVPLFGGCKRVVDLGCGRGRFLELLVEAGHDALGVDADKSCIAAVSEAGLPAVLAEVSDWLSSASEASVDGLFCAHLVEHLAHEAVMALFAEAHRVLSPGGVMVVVTPNSRALVSHLELYHQHFGHVRFYHPRLLRFYAHRAGFESVAEGENPALAGLLFGAPTARGAPGQPTAWPLAIAAPRFERLLPRRAGALGGAWWRLKMALARLVVLPYLDPLVADLHAAIAALNADRERLAAALDAVNASASGTQVDLHAALRLLDGSFEAYVVARKSDGGSAAPPGQAAS